MWKPKRCKKWIQLLKQTCQLWQLDVLKKFLHSGLFQDLQTVVLLFFVWVKVQATLWILVKGLKMNLTLKITEILHYDYMEWWTSTHPSNYSSRDFQPLSGFLVFVFQPAVTKEWQEKHLCKHSLGKHQVGLEGKSTYKMGDSYLLSHYSLTSIEGLQRLSP